MASDLPLSVPLISLLFTSEHGGNRVPEQYRALFRHARKELNSHRGFDPGSLELARHLSNATNAPLVATEWTRLLVEVNRSPRHRRLFSEFTRDLPDDVKQQIVANYYEPHRTQVEETLVELIQKNPPVVQIGVHTFTPELDGHVRNTEIGLLYDPARRKEQNFCLAWSEQIKRLLPEMRVRRNYPYLGKADGLVTYLRRGFSPREYLAIELEVNQALPDGSAAKWKSFQRRLAESLIAACQTFDS